MRPAGPADRQAAGARRAAASSRRMCSGSRASRRWSARCSGRCCMSRAFDADEIDAVIAAINRKGYGLTFGLHTRIEGRVQHVRRRHPCRQHLRQPQPDRRRRRLAALRRRGAVGHRAEGRRATLPAAAAAPRRGAAAGAEPAGPVVAAEALARVFRVSTLAAGPSAADRVAVLRQRARERSTASPGRRWRRPKRCRGRRATCRDRPARATG